jgi:hypothetical protein
VLARTYLASLLRGAPAQVDFGDALRLAVDELHYLLWDIREEEDKEWKNSDEYKELLKQRQDREFF